MIILKKITICKFWVTLYCQTLVSTFQSQIWRQISTTKTIIINSLVMKLGDQMILRSDQIIWMHHVHSWIVTWKGITSDSKTFVITTYIQIRIIKINNSDYYHHLSFSKSTIAVWISHVPPQSGVTWPTTTTSCTSLPLPLRITSLNILLGKTTPPFFWPTLWLAIR